MSEPQVKPLEWKDSDFPKSPEAMKGAIQYSICYDDDCEWNDNDQPYQLVRHGYEDAIMGSYFRQEDAKAAAQADYERRILGALIIKGDGDDS